MRVFDVAGGILLPTSDVASVGGILPALRLVAVAPANAPQHIAINSDRSNNPTTPMLTPIAILPPVDSPAFLLH